jgi:DNA-binding transcriptional LysR family regulator
MELRHLRYFVGVAEMENVSRAALKLHVSQPALSAQIRDLENEIGFQLLERTAKSVKLTKAGRAFLEEARAVLQRADEAVNKARSISAAERTSRRLFTNASRRNSSENPARISEKNAKRARQIARLDQPSHSRRVT